MKKFVNSFFKILNIDSSFCGAAILASREIEYRNTLIRGSGRKRDLKDVSSTTASAENRVVIKDQILVKIYVF